MVTTRAGRLSGAASYDLRRRYVFAAPDNDVLDAPGQIQISFLVKTAQIAGVKPAVFIDGLLIIGQLVIAIHQVFAPGDHLADFAPAQEAALAVSNADFDSLDGPAHCLRPLFHQVGGANHGQGRSLALAVLLSIRDAVSGPTCRDEIPYV